MQEYITREHYDQEFSCITISELQWLLQAAKPHSALWLMILLAVRCGLRCDELLHLTLYHFAPDFSSVRYRVDKPRKTAEDDAVVHTVKHRRVVIDDVWTREQLRLYCEKHFVLVQSGDGVQYCSPYCDLVPNKHGVMLSQKLFPWKSTQSFEMEWWRLRQRMKKAGFDAGRMERLTTWHTRQKQKPTLVVRFHKFRHMACTIYYYQHGQDRKAAQKWIHHSRGQTTDGYLHSAGELGTTAEFLLGASYAEVFGYVSSQRSLGGFAPSQTLLDMYE